MGKSSQKSSQSRFCTSNLNDHNLVNGYPHKKFDDLSSDSDSDYSIASTIVLDQNESRGKNVQQPPAFSTSTLFDEFSQVNVEVDRMFDKGRTIKPIEIKHSFVSEMRYEILKCGVRNCQQEAFVDCDCLNSSWGHGLCGIHRTSANLCVFGHDLMHYRTYMSHTGYQIVIETYMKEVVDLKALSYNSLIKLIKRFLGLPGRQALYSSNFVCLF